MFCSLRFHTCQLWLGKYFFSVFTSPACHPTPLNDSDNSIILSELNLLEIEVLNAF